MNSAGTVNTQVYRAHNLIIDKMSARDNCLSDIRKAIYTTNVIKSLNSVIRKAIKKRKLFLHDELAKKLIYLAIEQASKK